MNGTLNKVHIIGNLANDPETRHTPSGHIVTKIVVATNRSWKNSNGEKQEETEFHNIVVWGRLAEICQQYLRKGAKVYFEGRLKTRSWEDPNGNKRYFTDVVASEMGMLGNNRSQSSNSPEQNSTPASTPASTSSDDSFDSSTAANNTTNTTNTENATTESSDENSTSVTDLDASDDSDNSKKEEIKTDLPF